MAQEIEKLDSKDAQLIYNLEINGRDSLSSIGRKIRVSKEVVGYRLGRLVSRGIIKRFETNINQFALGKQQYRVLARTKVDPNHVVSKVAKQFNILARVRKLSPWNVDIAVWANNNLEFNEHIRKITNSNELHDIRILLITQRYTLLHAYLHKNQKSICLKHDELKLSKNEKSVLDCLQNDGRMSAVDIALKCNISAVAIAKIINKLEKNQVIVGVRVVLNSKKLGFDSYQVHFKFSTQEDILKAKTWLLNHVSVTGLREIVGDFDLECVIDVQNAHTLSTIIDSLKEKAVLTNVDIALLE